MIRFLYNLLYPLVLIAFLPGYIAKMFRRGNYRHKFGQRLGFYDRATQAKLASQPNTWLHAVSVGEVMIALKLAARMKERQPDLRVALTTTTTTGFTFANQQAPAWIEVLYTPLDFWPVMRRAFRVIRPSKIILVEAEVWPNLVATAHRRKIPLALVNARLSPRSEARFRCFNWFVRPYFQQLDLLCVQETADVGRWASLGAVSDRIHPVGSIKFDPENTAPRPESPRAALRDLGVDFDRPILLAGSTHPGEEEIMARIFLELRRQFPDLFLIIAPRHVERAAEITAQLTSLGLTTAKRSEHPAGRGSDCLLLDSTGELRDWYAVATIVFIGKSLTARGGQNPVEAIVAGRPVVFGSHMENFAIVARELVAAGGALQRNDEPSLMRTIDDLLDNPTAREELVRKASQVLSRHRGATERTAKLLEKLAPKPA